MKKILSSLLAIIMLLCVFPFGAVSVSADYVSGDFVYTISNGKATITKYVGSGGRVSVPNKLDGYSVTTIAQWAFWNCEALTSITISSSVQTISSGAFAACGNLSSVTISNGVTSILESAFAHCDNLSTVYIPASVSVIETAVFNDCDKLSTIQVAADNQTYSSRSGVLFSKDGDVLLQYPSGKNGEYSIPDGVIAIGDKAFSSAYGLTSIIFPDSVTNVGDSAFEQCTSLTTARLSKNLHIISNYMFYDCANLTSVAIPKSVVSIGESAFWGCDSLTNINIPDRVTSIGTFAFACSDKLSSIILPQSVTKIDAKAFFMCPSLANVYYTGSEKQWESMYIGSENDSLLNATIHYNVSGANTGDEGSIRQSLENMPIIDHGSYKGNQGDSTVYNLNGKGLSTYDEGERFNAYGNIGLDGTTYSNGFEVWLARWNYRSEISWAYATFDLGGKYETLTGNTSLIRSYNTNNFDTTVYFYGDEQLLCSYRLTNIDYEKEIVVDVTGVKQLKLYVKDNVAVNGGTSFALYDLFLDSIDFLQIEHSEKIYYSDGGFFSEKSSLSDCVELFLRYENYLSEDIKPITLTATVDGVGLSFDRNSNKKVYTTTIDTLASGESVGDLLMLFPHNLDLALSGNTYTVTIKLTSDSFGELTETCTFTVEDLETKVANEHLAYIATDKNYSLSKDNYFGKELVSVKDTADYKLSKVLSMNFDNYYEIVVADILTQILGANQVSTSLVPDVVKDWAKNYKTMLDGIIVILNDDYKDAVTISELEIDKFVKLCKYDADVVYANDNVYQTVMKVFQKSENVDKLKGVYKTIDVTGKAFGFVSFGVNVFKDAVEWGNKLTLFNAFDNADEELKEVMRTLEDTIPNSKSKMKEAINDYINYSYSDSGKVLETLESFTGMLADVSLETFDALVGKSVVQYVFGVQVLSWIGTIPVAGGVAFSTTAKFATVQSAFGGFFTGVTLGICVSDILCDTSDKSEEMCKIVSISEFSPYIIETLETYEQKLIKNRNNATVAEYEYAFALHKATQVYIAAHTIKELEIERDSIVIKLFGKEDYNGTIAAVQDYKNKTESMYCHGNGNIVLAAPIILQQPESIQVQNGATVKVSVEALGDGITYQWYLKNAGATKYSKSSITTNTYSTKMSASSRDRSVYCIVKDKNGKAVKTNAVVLGMAASIISQPTTEIVSAPFGETVKIPIKALGDELTYTWYIKSENSSPFLGFSKSSVKSSTYSVTMNDKSNGRQVYCVIRDTYSNTVVTNTFTLRPYAVITAQPKTDYAKMGKEVSVSVRASGKGLKYQWYIKNDGQTKYSKSSVTGRTYSTTMTAKSKNRRVLCRVYDKYGNVVQSNSVLLREAVSITTQPKTTTVKKNATAKVTVKASGDGLKYTWYVKNAGAKKYSKSSITKSTYSAKMTSKVKNRLVYCVVTDKYGKTVKSTTVKLKMK